MSKTAGFSTAIVIGLACGCSNFSVTTRESHQGATQRGVIAPQSRGTAIIRGRVTTIAGEPLDAVAVNASAASIGSFGPTLTTADGRFEFRGLPAGRYQLFAWRREFLLWRYRQVATDDRDIAGIDVADGQIVDSIEVALPRGAVITGRVVDGDARPVANMRVMLVKRDFRLGQIALRPFSTAPHAGSEGLAASTNGRGEYRLFGVPPGDYLVLALSPGLRELPRTNGLGFAIANTFYPSATSASAAVPVSLGFADVRDGITITRATVPVFEIRGSVIDKAGRHSSAGVVQVNRRGDLSSGSFGLGLEAESRIQPNGEFTLTDVRPGLYSVRALLAGPEPRADSPVERQLNYHNSMAGTVADLNNEHLTGLRIVASGLVHVRGRIVFNDATAARSIDPATVCASPRVWEIDDAWFAVGTIVDGPVSQGTSFDWMTKSGRIRADAYLCSERLDDVRTWHVQTIRADGRNVTDSGFGIDAVDPPELEILLTNRQPRLTGIVTDESGSPLSNRVVIVFAQDRTRWVIPHSRYFSVTFTDGSGRYRAAVPAGDYYVAATGQGSMGSWTDPTFLTSLVPHAHRVSLHERERASLNLAVAPLPVPRLR